MSDVIDDLIKSCDFTETDVMRATQGECMWFAIALHKILQERQIETLLMVATRGPRGLMQVNWAHALIRRRRTHHYYDIRGRVLPSDIHRQFRTACIVVRSKEMILADSWFGTQANPVADWHDRLVGESHG